MVSAYQPHLQSVGHPAAAPRPGFDITLLQLLWHHCIPITPGFPQRHTTHSALGHTSITQCTYTNKQVKAKHTRCPSLEEEKCDKKKKSERYGLTCQLSQMFMRKEERSSRVDGEQTRDRIPLSQERDHEYKV